MTPSIFCCQRDREIDFFSRLQPKCFWVIHCSSEITSIRVQRKRSILNIFVIFSKITNALHASFFICCEKHNDIVLRNKTFSFQFGKCCNQSGCSCFVIRSTTPMEESIYFGHFKRVCNPRIFHCRNNINMSHHNHRFCRRLSTIDCI